jgi:hypothetical protein
MTTQAQAATYAAVLDTLATVAVPTYAIGWDMRLDTTPVAPADPTATDRHRAELAALSLYHLWGRITAVAHERYSDSITLAPGRTAVIRSRLNIAYMSIMDGELLRATRTLRHIALDANDMYEDHNAAASEADGQGRMISVCAPTKPTTP